MKNIFLKLSICVPLIGIISCNDDYLDKFPIDNPSVSSFLQTVEELKLAVNGAYEELWYSPNYGLPIEQHLDLTSDIGWNRAWGDFQLLGNGTVDPGNSVILSFWTHYYRGIQRCNYILQNAENIQEISDEDLFKRLISETRFLRSYFYYHLTEMFGDIPFLTEVLTLENSYIEKTKKEQIVNFMLDELEEASLNLPTTYTNTNDIGRITKGAALALKSRIALFNKDWQTTIDAANRVMTLGYSLDNEYSLLFQKEGQTNSKEIVLILDYLYGTKIHLAPRWIGTRMASGFSGLIPVQSMIDSYQCVDGITIDKSPLYDPQKPFVNRDPRLSYSTIVPGSIFHGYQFETHRDSLKCWNYNVSPPKRVTNTDATNAYSSFSGYCWRKYATYSDPSQLLECETGIILIRYAEVLLNYIEAKIEANDIDQSVYDILNQIRKRVNMPDIKVGKSQTELRSVLRMERKVELAFEGLRLYDIRRWNIAEKVLDGPLYGRIQRGLLSSAPTIDENGTPDYSNVANKNDMRVIETRTFAKSKNYLWPIPQYEIDLNEKIIQNSGY